MFKMRCHFMQLIDYDRNKLGEDEANKLVAIAEDVAKSFGKGFRTKVTKQPVHSVWDGYVTVDIEVKHSLICERLIGRMLQNGIKCKIDFNA